MRTRERRKERKAENVQDIYKISATTRPRSMRTAQRAAHTGYLAFGIVKATTAHLDTVTAWAQSLSPPGARRDSMPRVVDRRRGSRRYRHRLSTTASSRELSGEEIAHERVVDDWQRHQRSLACYVNIGHACWVDIAVHLCFGTHTRGFVPEALSVMRSSRRVSAGDGSQLSHLRNPSISPTQYSAYRLSRIVQQFQTTANGSQPHPSYTASPPAAGTETSTPHMRAGGRNGTWRRRPRRNNGIRCNRSVGQLTI